MDGKPQRHYILKNKQEYGISILLSLAMLEFGSFSALCTGCSSGTDYWTNRLDDAKDIVSFTAGTGFGVKAQAGPIQADTGYNYAPFGGLRGGEIFSAGGNPEKHTAEYHVGEGNIGVFLPFCNAEIFFPGRHAADRGKAYCALTPCLPVFILSPDDHSLTFCNSCAWKRTSARRRAQREKYARLSPEEQKKVSGQLAPLTEAEEKTLREELDKMYPPPQVFDGWRAWYKYSSIEVTVALFFGFSTGINPGELLDFLAGFVCLDIYRDDI